MVPQPKKKVIVKNVLKNYKLKQFNDEEQKVLMKKQENYMENQFQQRISNLTTQNPLTGDIEPLRPFKKMELNKHQIDFVKKVLFNDTRGAIAFHGVGTGKTLTAVLTAKLWLMIHNNQPDYKVFVITPNATLLNFINEMIDYGTDPRDNRYKYFTYDGFHRNGMHSDEKTLVIIDEAHNFRTYMNIGKKISEDTGKLIESSTSNIKGYKILKYATFKAGKVVLLTGTPFVNMKYDIENLMTMIKGTIKPLDRTEYADMELSKSLRHDYFRYKISHFEKSQTSDDYPRREEQLVPIVLNKEDENKYNRMTSGFDGKLIDDYFNLKQREIKATPADYMKSFYLGIRQYADSFDNMKVNYIIKLIRDNPNDKFAIYITFEEYGLKLLTSKLKPNEYGLISGKKTKEEKENYIIDYNNDKVKIMIFTKAGMEGVSLMKTQYMIMYDEAWNEASNEQAIARAIRYKSHVSIEKIEDRVVKVRKLLIVKENELPIIEAINDGSIENLGYKIIADSFRKALNPEKTKNDMVKLEEKYDPTAIQLKAKLRTLRKRKLTEEELKKQENDKQEIYKKLQSDRFASYNKMGQFLNQEYDIGGKKFKFNGTPSIDLYMMLLSKAKQDVIDAFIKELDKIPQLEDLKTNKEEKMNIEIMKINNKSKPLNEKGELEIYRKYFGETQVKVINELDIINDMRINEKTIDFSNALNTLNTIEKTKGDYSKKQEFFTPKEIAKDLIDFSGIANVYNPINILEPTTGHGALVAPILKAMVGRNINIDMVEYVEDNRKVLRKLIEDTKCGEFLSLQETRDFLLFINPKKYDYIIMNPPFHLKQKENPQYNRDVYDIDFLMRAYKMIGKGGVITAITGNHYETAEKYSEWLSSVGATIVKKSSPWKPEIGAQKINRLNYSFIKIVKKNDEDDEDDFFKIFNKDFIKEYQRTLRVKKMIKDTEDLISKTEKSKIKSAEQKSKGEELIKMIDRLMKKDLKEVKVKSKKVILDDDTLYTL